MKKLMTILTVALFGIPVVVSAQTPATSGIPVSGAISTGGRTVDNDTNSSKLTEYRDLSDKVYLPVLSLNLFDTERRRFFQFGARTSV
jgi:hypothetical protein